jgi:YD repeat-containing protein
LVRWGLSCAYTRPDGNTYIFEKISGAYREINGNGVRLEFTNNTWRFTDKDGSVDTFTNGLLSSRKLPNGKAIEVVRDVSQRIKELLFGGHQILSIQYNGAGQIGSVTNGNNAVSYEYQEARNLTKVTPNDQPSTTYHYEKPGFPHHLTAITDAKGTRFAEWAYDSLGRAITSEHAGGKEKYSIDYTNLNDLTDSRTMVTNPLGKKTVYHYGIYQGIRKIKSVEGQASANCAAANKAYDYYPNGTLKSKTDWQGNITTYERDDYGRETSRTEALGAPDQRSIKTCWHPSLNQPERIIEADKVTVYTYEQGLIKTQSVQPRTSANSQCLN